MLIPATSLRHHSDDPPTESLIAAMSGDDAEAQLAVALEKIANLEQALVTCRTIGMALGIVMSRYALTPDQAFDRLRYASQCSGDKVVKVADQVVFIGDLP